MENKYVLKPYMQIAEHFDKTREYMWKGIKDFIKSKNSSDFLLDAGCGNGKNMLAKNKGINLIFAPHKHLLCLYNNLCLTTISEFFFFLPEVKIH